MVVLYTREKKELKNAYRKERIEKCAIYGRECARRSKENGN